MNFLVFILIGLIAGWIAGKVVIGHSFGVPGDIAIGVVGAFIGGLLFPRPAIVDPYGFYGPLIMATLGSIVLLVVARLIRALVDGPTRST